MCQPENTPVGSVVVHRRHTSSSSCCRSNVEHKKTNAVTRDSVSRISRHCLIESLTASRWRQNDLVSWRKRQNQQVTKVIPKRQVKNGISAIGFWTGSASSAILFPPTSQILQMNIDAIRRRNTMTYWWHILWQTKQPRPQYCSWRVSQCRRCDFLNEWYNST